MLRAEFEDGTSAVIEKTVTQLDEFFAGKREVFDIPLLFVGTDFQKKVWDELQKYLMGRRFLMARWRDASVCRKLSVP